MKRAERRGKKIIAFFAVAGIAAGSGDYSDAQIAMS